MRISGSLDREVEKIKDYDKFIFLKCCKVILLKRRKVVILRGGEGITGFCKSVNL